MRGHRHLICAIMLAPLAVPVATVPPAAAQRASDTIAAGRNSAGEPCTISRVWGETSRATDAVYALTCRNVAASRAIGRIHIIRPDPALERKLEDELACGAPATVSVRGIGPVQARRCAHARLGIETVTISYRKRGNFVLASVAPPAIGPLEEALRLVAEGDSPRPDSGRAIEASFDPLTLAPAPAAETTAVADAPFDPSIALQLGVDLNHKGLHVEASRVLNDAISRLPASAASATRAELLLEAGLADSNIRFFDAAKEHFDRAAELLARPDLAGNAFLIGKADTYRALDLLNRRQYSAALTALDRLAVDQPRTDSPLLDPANLREINQPAYRAGDVGNAVAVPDTTALKQIVVNAQAHWARSIALFALGDRAGAAAALTAASEAYAPLRNERIDPSQVLWLGARIERQRGRLFAAEGQYDQAIAAFDRSLEDLRRSAIQTAGTGTEPSVAETLLERAGIVAQRGGDPAAIRREYDGAIDAVIASGATNVNTIALERYLDLLAADPRSEDTAERYFKALQAVGEPAVARQVSQLQAVVANDPELGVKIRDRADLARDVTALGYRIAEAEADPDAEGQAPVADLRRQLDETQRRLDAVETALFADGRYSTVDERPATVAEIRALLKPGELFFKLSALNRRAFGIVIAADETFIYPVEAPLDTLETLARCVRFSIDGGLKPVDAALLGTMSQDCRTDYRKLATGSLVAYDVSGASALFTLIAGPAAEKLTAATSIIADPAGPLKSIPVGVLVTDRASVDRYRASRTNDPFNLSGVSFLARKAAISTALSPRSFVVARRLPPSRAPNPFIGFASPSAPEDVVPDVTVNVGFGCPASANLLRRYWRAQATIPDTEIGYAVGALGLEQAPLVSGAAFTDKAIAARGDLDQYEVLHFATHGFEEGVWGCPKSPPALMTSFGDADSDGLLSFSEVAALNLDANLVVLSACDTSSGVRSEALARASGQEQVGSTLEGLVRAFLTANSRAVMATHWQIANTQETEQLIGDFYEAARTWPIGAALQSAQSRLMGTAQFSHPFYWGAFFVVGDSTKMMLTPEAAAAPAPGKAAAGAH